MKNTVKKTAAKKTAPKAKPVSKAKAERQPRPTMLSTAASILLKERAKARAARPPLVEADARVIKAAKFIDDNLIHKTPPNRSEPMTIPPTISNATRGEIERRIADGKILLQCTPLNSDKMVVKPQTVDVKTVEEIARSTPLPSLYPTMPSHDKDLGGLYDEKYKQAHAKAVPESFRRKPKDATRQDAVYKTGLKTSNMWSIVTPGAWDKYAASVTVEDAGVRVLEKNNRAAHLTILRVKFYLDSSDKVAGDLKLLLQSEAAVRISIKLNEKSCLETSYIGRLIDVTPGCELSGEPDTVLTAIATFICSKSVPLLETV